MIVPIKDYERCFQNWIDHLKSCKRADEEYFVGHGKVKLPHYVYLRRTKASDIIFGTPLVHSEQRPFQTWDSLIQS